MTDRLLPLLLLVAPVVLLVGAVQLRRARDARGAYAAGPRVTAAQPWDRSLRNGMLMGITGLLLVPAGLYAFSLLQSRRWAPVFMVPVIAGVVLISAGYRAWMRGVAQVPED